MGKISKQSSKYKCSKCNDTTWIFNSEGKVIARCECYQADYTRRLWENYGIKPEEVKKLNEYKPFNALTNSLKTKASNYILQFNEIYVTDEKCIQSGTLNDWCKKAGRMIGVPTLHDHDLRHSGSNILKELGMELQDIAELLHHSSTETTVKHYLSVNKKKVKENKDKFTF